MSRIFASTPILLLAVGLYLTFEAVMTSGFAVVPADPGDMRLVGFLLEHGYQWVAREPLHASYWDAPFLYPLKNVMALTETFLGTAPLYWLPRAIGFGPYVSLDLWLIAQVTLNFAAFFFFLRRALRLSSLSAAAGAYLFAFASIRLNQLGHPQMLPQFYTVIALHGLWIALRSTGPSPLFGFSLFAFMTVAQLYAGFYLGWFWILALVVALALATAFRRTRDSLDIAMQSLTTWRAAIVMILAAVSLAPLAVHYLDAARDVGLRNFEEVATMIPRWRSWLNFGPDHVLFGRWHGTITAGQLAWEWEHRIGVGVFTLVAAIAGVWRVRREPWAPVVFGTAIVLVALALSVDGFTLWEYVFRFFPAGGSIRAVSRIALLLLVPASIAVACFFEGLVRSGRRPLQAATLALVALLAAEQYVPLPSFAYEPIVARQQALQAKVDPTCPAFLYTPSPACRPDDLWITLHVRAVDAHVDAMWTAIGSGVPTINGYSGSFPPGYAFWGLSYCRPEDAEHIRGLIDGWCKRNGCDAASVCWIR